MKKVIYNILTAAVAAAAICSCNEAKFVTAEYVTLNTTRYTFNEDDGIVAIPVAFFGEGDCQVSFIVTDGTAKQGEDFSIVYKDGTPNETGLVSLSSDKEKNDSIWIKLVYDTKLTKGKNFSIALGEPSTEGVVVSGTKQCGVTVNDLEYAVSAYFGSWSTEGTDEKNTIAFDIEEYDIEKDEDEIAEYYPECCLKIPASSSANILGTSVGGDIYGYYSAADKTICLYSYQVYNALNFSIGPHFLGLENADDYTQDVILNTGDKSITFSTRVIIRLYSYPAGERTEYGYGAIPAETVMVKTK